MRLLLPITLCLFALAVSADEIDPPLPALYAVSEVAAGDVLNIRARPDAQADIIGSLGPQAEGIEVIGLSRSGTWAEINVSEGRGWVAMRYLRQDTMPRNALGLPDGLQCFGTEPFWTMRFGDAASLTLSTPEGDTRHGIQSTAPLPANVDLATGGFRFIWNSASGPATAHILPGRCADGMSDRGYGLHYLDDIGPRRGCCSLN